MSHIDASPLSAYNSLADKHLAGYFANTRMRHHLRKSGLITRRGDIVHPTAYRLNMARKEHKKHVKDLLAQAIVNKTLDLERHRQVAIRRKLEEIAKIEMVQRVKDERKQHALSDSVLPLITSTRDRGTDSPRTPVIIHHAQCPREDEVIIEERHQRERRNDEDILPYLSPRSSRPHSGPEPQSHRSQRSAKYRPISAPSNMPDTNSSLYESNDEDVTYVDDDGNTIDMSDFEPVSNRSRGRCRTPRGREEIDARHLYSLNPAALRRYATLLAKMEHNNSLVSPYLTPQVPIPPSSPRSAPVRHRSAGRRCRSTSSDKSPRRSPARELHRHEPAMQHLGDVHSMCKITMKYHGWALNLAREKMDPRHEILIEQQHCGGNTLTVFREKMLPGSTFSFISKRHRGYPFSLTLYVDGRQDSRVSTCCEFGHSKKVRLGGKQGHFSFVSIDGMTPCYKCQVQKGLKGSKSPPKKLTRPSKDTGEEVIVMETVSKEKSASKKDGKAQKQKEDEETNEQILVPVELDGEANGKTNEHEASDENYGYESDFDDEQEENEQPDEGGGKTARTDVEVEGLDVDISHHSGHNEEHLNKNTSYSFLTSDQREVTAVEESIHDDSHNSKSSSKSSDESFMRMKARYDEALKEHSSSVSSSEDGEGQQKPASSVSFNKTKSSGSSAQAKSSKKSSRSSGISKSLSSDTYPEEAPGLESSVQAELEADTADDVSDIETDLEWPTKEDKLCAAKTSNNSLPPKPQKPKGILSPRTRKKKGPKKKTSFKTEGNDAVDKESNQQLHEEKCDDKQKEMDPEKDECEKVKKKQRRRKNFKNYEIGIVPYEESENDVEKAVDTSSKENDSGIPEISVNRAGSVLFSDRAQEDVPCREYVTVGIEEDERGTETDEGEWARCSKIGLEERGHSELERTDADDVIAEYAARLSEIEDRAVDQSDEEQDEDGRNGDVPPAPLDMSTNPAETKTNESINTPAVVIETSELAASCLPKILIDNTDPSLREGESIDIDELDDKVNDLIEVTLSDIRSRPSGMCRRVSAGSESLLSVPCSDIEENDYAIWAGTCNAANRMESDSGSQQDVFTEDGKKSSSPDRKGSSPDRKSSSLEGNIPEIVVKDEWSSNIEKHQRTIPVIVVEDQPLKDDSSSSDSSSSSSESDSDTDTDLKKVNARQQFSPPRKPITQTVPTIITELVD